MAFLIGCVVGFVLAFAFAARTVAYREKMKFTEAAVSLFRFTRDSWL